MKRILSFFLWIALAAAGLAQMVTAEGPAAVFYEYPGFQGGSLAVGPGFSMSASDGLRYDNGHPVAGNILSMRVAYGPVSLYEQPGFAGQVMLVNADVADIRSVNLNGTLADLRYAFNSLRVGAVLPAAPVVMAPTRPVLDPDEVIVRVYLEFFGRRPDERTLLEYRRHMREEHWEEDAVRRDFRRSPEWQAGLSRVIGKAYRDVLGREPDRAGLVHYRKEFIERGMSEQRLREDLRRSDEYRGPVVNRLIAQAYRDVLHRDPDPSGLEHYRKEVIDHGLTDERLREELRHSAEAKSGGNDNAGGRENSSRGPSHH